MRSPFLLPVLLLFLSPFLATSAESLSQTVRHSLRIQLTPNIHQIQVRDKITLPKNAGGTIVFSLHEGMNPKLQEKGGKLGKISTRKREVFNRYRLDLPPGLKTFTLLYQGMIHHPLEAYGKEQARGFRDSPGTISSEGVYLESSTFWYPVFDDFPWIQFELQADLPRGWNAVSQGTGSWSSSIDERIQVSWDSPTPQEEIYLIAAPFHFYKRRFQKISAQVYLREKDPALANKYLDTTGLYLDLYEKLLGAYPYSKFALVENFWETGFGMPSFTLLGPRVIRLPFILHSSYPHEILHNWWGNGVYVDYSKGNWCEGLTAYLADHLIKEQRGRGAEHRLQSLQKYTDYALEGRDFSLADFKGRHSSASEAVGYGKAMMLFHMIRRMLGDENFSLALRDFYTNHRYQKASFNDLRVSFEKFSKNPLQDVFTQWVHRTGAPSLKLQDSALIQKGDGYLLKFTLSQTQTGEDFSLDVPLAVTLEGKKQAYQKTVSLNSRLKTYSLELDSKPTRLDIDPEFDLFRSLAIEETPPAFTKLFGSPRMAVVLPRQSEEKWRKAWEAFAGDLSRMGPEQVETYWDDELENLPSDQAITILGWENRFFRQVLNDLSGYPLQFHGEKIRLERSEYTRDGHALALAYRTTGGKSFARAFIGAEVIESLPGLGRKLPHYHKYSYLVFSGDEPQNQLKGRWPVTNSPMSTQFSKPAAMGELQKREALARPAQVFDSQRMLQTIHYLSSEDLAGRGFGEPGLDLAAEYIRRKFQEIGLAPVGNESYFQTFSSRGGETQAEAILKNVVGVLPGTNPEFASQSVVIGAHYDHLGRGWPNPRKGQKGKIHFGSDDNASGVAVLIELARVLKTTLKPERSIVFAAFSAEESGRRGSKNYVKNQKIYPAEQCIGMINLDTVGRLANKKLLVIGSQSAREWPHIFRGVSYVTGVSTSMVSEMLDSSDHVSFHEVGVPAIQLFSGANLDYHRPTDTAEKIDASGLVKVATVLKETVEYLAGRKEAMNHTLKTASQKSPGTKKTTRNVSLGTVPDFTYQGKGYRLDGTVEGSPARKAGLRKGDIVLKIDDHSITGLRDLSKVLKSMKPGQSITITYQREESIQTSKVILHAN